MYGPKEYEGSQLEDEILFWFKLAANVQDFAIMSGPSLELVPRVPGTHEILSSYVMAPVNFSEISG